MRPFWVTYAAHARRFLSLEPSLYSSAWKSAPSEVYKRKAMNTISYDGATTLRRIARH